MRKTLLLLSCFIYLINAKAAHEQAIEMFYDYNQQSGTYDFSLVVYVPTTGSYPPSVVLSSNHPTISSLNLPVDATGKQIMFGQYTDAQAIDTLHLPRGFYTYRIVTTTGMHSGKLVK